MKLTAALPLLLFMSSCSRLLPSSAPGVQTKEAQVLSQCYYWKPGDTPAKYSDADLEKLFLSVRKAPSTELDERAQQCCAQLVQALAVAGDKPFARVLAQQPDDVRKEVLHYVSSTWTSRGLSYPRTQALARVGNKRA